MPFIKGHTQSNTGRTHFKKGYVPWHKGKENVYSKETLKKMSEAKMGNKSSEETRKKQSEALSGRTLSEDHKRKIGLASMGKRPSNKTRRKLSKAHRGKKLSETTKIKISEAIKKSLPSTAYKKKDTRITGENNNMWQGGKSFEPYGKEFNEKLKEKIRERDNYRCQQCFRHQDELFSNTKSGIKLRRLDVHHIDYQKKNNDEENLISLCMTCHRQTNFGREDWTKYFEGKVNA